MAHQSDHLANANQSVTTNTYDWLQSREQEERMSYSAQNSAALKNMGRWSSFVWHADEAAEVDQRIRGDPYEIQYSVFEPVVGYTRWPPLPNRDITRQSFHEVVHDCTEAITKHNIELQRIQAGSSGSYFAYGTATADTPLGVFKPKDEEPYGPLSPKWTKWAHRTFFPCFFGRSCLIPNLGYICESAASVMDELLGTNLVPHTEVVSLMSKNFYDKKRAWFSTEPRYRHKIGSLQRFVEGYIGASEFLEEHPFPGVYRDRQVAQPEDEFHWNAQTLASFRFEIEKLVILDYMIRNTDRGLDNWMIKVRQLPNKEWEIKLAAIDNGLAFPWKHPDEWRSFPYGWLYLPVNVLGQPFSEATRRHFLPLLTSTKWWETCFAELTAQFSRDAEFKSRMWKKQWSVLKGQAFNVVETLKNPTQGPLELVRRTQTLVIDDIMHVPSNTLPLAILNNAMEEPITVSASSPMVSSSLPEDGSPTDAYVARTATNPQDSTEEPPIFPKRYSSKKVVIERLMLVNSKPPVFTWW
ncbi:LANO_0D08592g1_1 [Lachancea nothofagi CBS 11611]|uniref:Phosphatidylinositol 4-kinase n=1 Tax=Lachancea nothofagi CBS 11611 TaxID=1266666 RepID=A0A1G4JJ23_9SACH|nr:LANO_0D08592g1_1 [Lachancea nothofagi CBS 11611]